MDFGKKATKRAKRAKRGKAGTKTRKMTLAKLRAFAKKRRVSIYKKKRR
jgi:hypothetical protein